MVADGYSSEVNNFAINGHTGSNPHLQTYTIKDSSGNVSGTYSIQVTPPSESDSNITVKVTGTSNSPADLSRTIQAHIGRPSFSQYVLLVNGSVDIGGPLNRLWSGKTHSNTGIEIETSNINDTISCASSSYVSSGTTEPGIWSSAVPSNDPSRALWQYPVPPIDFNTVTADFSALSAAATGVNNLPEVGSGSTVGWYIQLLPNEQYEVAKVTGEYESRSYSSGNNNGGYLTYGAFSSPLPYPANGIIFSNDNVWVRGTNLSGRITIASSGQSVGKTTNINIVGDITYGAKDGTVAVGLIAQNDIKIPMYAPMGEAGNLSTMNMEIDGALIAEQGAEYVNSDSSGSSSSWGPRRNLLTFYGSVSSFDTPYREYTSGSDYCGFANGANTYDSYLLHDPPPNFPTVGTYQILDWCELPSSQAVTITSN
jgi:hypothetical protein